MFAKRDLSLLTSDSSHSQTETGAEPEGGRYSRRLSSVGSKLADWSRRKSSFALPHRGHSDSSSPGGLSPIPPSEASLPNSPAFTSPAAHTALPMGGTHTSFSVSFPGRETRTDEAEQLAEMRAPVMAFNGHGGEVTASPGQMESGREWPTPTPTTSSPPTAYRAAPKRASFMVDQLQSAGSFALEVPRRVTGLVSHPGSFSLSRKQRGLKPLSPRQLNRRLSILMSLYPIAYLILFSVSVARLAYQLARPGVPVNPGLVIASRLLVYGQGLLDGVIYFFIEWVFKRMTKGRT